MILRLLFSAIFLVGVAAAQEPGYDFVLFSNSRMGGDYFFSHASYTAPSFIRAANNKIPVSEKIFHTPGQSLNIEYTNGKNGKWEVLISKPEIRGMDHFKKPELLSFWIRANSIVSTKALPLVRFMGRDSSFSKSAPIKIDAGTAWKRVSIPIDQFGSVDDSVHGEILAISFYQNGTDGIRHNLYVDDIEVVPATSNAGNKVAPILLNAKGYAKHVDISWTPVTDESIKYIKIYRSVDGKNYKPVAVQNPDISRYADFVGLTGKKFYYKITSQYADYTESSPSPVLSSSTHKMTDEELMTMVQEACFRYYWEGAEKTSGLAKENIPGRRSMIAMGASGFGIMALLVGAEKKFITRQQLVDRFTQIVNFLETTETFHGAFSHFVNGPNGKVEPFFGDRDNGGDLVETSFLIQGLIAARAYFNGTDPREKMIHDEITSIWNRVEWDWYRHEANSKFLTWHWSPDKEWIINHHLIGWNETMVTYLLAIASPTHAVPASLYYSGWANRDSTGKQYRQDWGGTTDGSDYINGKTFYEIKLDVGVSNGGPLFFTHYSYLGYDPHGITDKYTNYFKNNRHIAEINLRYSMTNPNRYKDYSDSCWGMTASDGPYNYSADEPIAARDLGKIGPTGAIASFPYTPEASMKALRNYYNSYGKFIWGEYGFYDAFSLKENWCSDIYMGLNQAPMVVMIENYRNGFIWNLFMSDKDVKQGLKKLEEETSKQ